MTGAEMPRSGHCRGCGTAILWATMPSGRLNPLNVEPVSPELGRGVNAYNPGTGKGWPLIEANCDQVQKWAEDGITFHTSHFSNCPARERFRREKVGER